MKKELTTDFQTRLWTAIKSIERASQAEVIVVLRASSHAYPDIPLLWGIIAAWIHPYVHDVRARSFPKLAGLLPADLRLCTQLRFCAPASDKAAVQQTVHFTKKC